MLSSIVRKYVVILFIISCCFVAKAVTFEKDGLTYSLSENDGNLTVVSPTTGETYAITGDLIIPETVCHEGQTYTVTRIGYKAFCESDVSSVSLPPTMTEIEEEAFRSCMNLVSINIPSAVTSIGARAFYYCKKLSSLHISKARMKIGDEAFRYAPLSSLWLINSDMTWGLHVFAETDVKELITTSNINTSVGLASDYKIAYGSNVTIIGNNKVSSLVSSLSISFPINNSLIEDSGVIYSADKSILYYVPLFYKGGFELPESVSTLFHKESTAYTPFKRCAHIESITLNDNITEIGDREFEGCESLVSVSLGEETASIGVCAFAQTGLESIELPATVTAVGNGAFSYCRKLRQIELPEGVTVIEPFTFEHCVNLTDITLPASLESIGSLSFANDNALRNIRSLATDPPSAQNCFPDEIYGTCSLLVPAEAVNNYKTADIWKNFTITELPADNTLTINGQEAYSVILRLKESQAVTLTLISDPDWQINTVYFNDKDVTTKIIDGKYYTTPKISGSNSLTIVAEQENSDVIATVINKPDVKIKIINNTVMIEGLSDNDEIMIADINGTGVYQGTRHTVELQPGRMYIMDAKYKKFKFAL